jgi:hypothetical protein
MYRALGFATAATAVWLIACAGDIEGRIAGDPDGPGSEPPRGGDSAEGKLSTNGLALDLDALAQLGPLPLGSWESTRAVASSPSLAALLAGPSGLEQVAYLALCALDRGTELVVDAAGDEVSFPGLYGLAPEWVSQECGLSCQRWVSACLVAHANAFGYRVPISLRGKHPGLVWDEAIEADYPLQEGAFYGNLFDAEEPVAYACAGRALIDFDDDFGGDWTFADGADRYLTQRICSTGQPCGLENTGLCHLPSEVANELASACATDAGEASYYGGCRKTAAGPVHGASTVDEVITTYLGRD